MPEPSPRKRFQFHLSTAIMMMFVAGGLVWANVSKRRIEYIGARIGGGSNYKFPDVSEADYLRNGPPIGFLGTRKSVSGWPADALLVETKGVVINQDGGTSMGGSLRDWHAGAIVGNMSVALAILLAAWFVCEWLIRRAARRG